MVGFIRSSGGSGSSIDTSDATATAAEILEGYIAYAGQERLVGRIKSKQAALIIPGTEDKEIAAGQYLAGTQTVLGDTGLKSSNIKKGATIFNISGAENVIDTTQSADAMTADKLLAGCKGFVNGAEVNGSMANRAGSSQTAAGNVSGSTLYLALPQAGYYDTAAKLGIGFSALASLLGISSSKIVSGYSICGVDGTHQCQQQLLSGFNYKIGAMSGGTSKSISCSFTPRAVAWLISGSYDGITYSGSQLRIGGWQIDDDGYYSAVGTNTNPGMTWTVASGCSMGSSSVTIPASHTTSGVDYDYIVLGEDS